MNEIMDNRRCGGRGGFTLIEMMIALAIMAIALTAIFSSFSFQHKSYVTQNAVAQMQQSVRGGLAFMEGDLRNAASVPSTNINIPSQLFGGSVPTSLVSGLGIKDGGANGSDNIYIISLIGGDTYLQKAPGQSVLNSSEAEVSDVTGWAIGDFGIIYDATNADMFFTTQVQASPTKLQHNPAGSIFSDNKFTHNYASGTRIARIRYSGYSIDSSTNLAHPVLVRWGVDNTGTMISEIVAEDIEDMQVLLGVYDNVAGTITERNGDWFATHASDLAMVRQVRIQLVGRSPMADAAWNEGAYYNTRYNRTWGAGGYDHHRRRPLEQIIHIRNAGL